MKIHNRNEYSKLKENQEIEISGRISKRRRYKDFTIFELSLYDGNVMVLIDNENKGKKMKMGTIVTAKGYTYLSKEQKLGLKCYDFGILNEPVSFKEEDGNLCSILKERFELETTARKYFLEKGLYEVDSKILFNHKGSPDTPHFETKTWENEPRYLRTTLELLLRRYVYRTQIPVFEIGHVFRDLVVQKNSLNEYAVLEAQIPYENIDYGLELLLDVLYRIEDKFEAEGKLLPKRNLDIRNLIKIDKTSTSSEIEREYKLLRDSQKVPTLLSYIPSDITPLSMRLPGGYAKKIKYVSDIGEICEVYEPETNYNRIRLMFEEQNTFMKERGIEGEMDMEFLKDCERGIVPTLGIYLGLDRLLMLLNEKDIREFYI